jgi:hypothetical protein
LTNKVLSIREVVATYSDGLPDWQRAVNTEHLYAVHAMLHEGGVWIAPEMGTVYERRGDGFVYRDGASSKPEGIL